MCPPHLTLGSDAAWPAPRDGDRSRPPSVSVVVPVHNEAANLEALHQRLTTVLRATGLAHEIVLVDDGSQDGSGVLLERLARRDPHVAVVTLSRNFGHQAAVTAGLDHSRGQAVIVMDGDLQDPPEVIPGLLERWQAGFDVVYAVRAARKEGLLKRAGYSGFYRLLNAISELPIPRDSGDFGLLDRRVVDALAALPERARFVRGLRTFVGFRQTAYVYERAARAAGTPKYTFRKLVRLAIDGLISFSGEPLRLVTRLGLATAAVSAGLLVWVLVDALRNHTAPRGWASTIVVVLFMGAVQLVSLGIIGEYIRLIFVESKGRPTYIVARYTPAGADPERSRPARDRARSGRSPA